MKLFAVVVALCCGAGLAQARPVVIQETARIPTPDSRFYLYKAVVEGDDMVAIGLYNYITDGYWSDTDSAAFLFRRTGTTWSYVKTLGTGFDTGLDDAHPHYSIAIKNGVLATGLVPMHVFEKRNGDWVKVKTFGGDSDDIVIDNGRMLFGSLCWGAVVIERDSAGIWQGTQALRGDVCDLSDAARGGSAGFVGNWASVRNESNDDDDDRPTPAITLFRQTSSAPTSWVEQDRITPAAGHTVGDVAMGHGPGGVDELYLSDYLVFGTPIYRRSGNVWSEDHRLHSTGEFMASPFGGSDSGFITNSDRYLFRRVWDHDRDEYVGEVFQPDANGKYEHVATLVSSDGNGIGEIYGNGNQAVAGGNGANVLYFELPTTFSTPAVVQDTFAIGNGAGWTSVPGSQWAALQGSTSRVYRQSNTAGDAGAVLDAADWTNQSVQADVTATTFNGNDRWVGLAARRTDASNYYYVTLRSSGNVVLKRMKNGVFTNLASASFPVSLNRAYRLRLESIGSQQRVYIDGVRVLEAVDAGLTHGHAALLMYRTAADFDNVVVTPNDASTIYSVDTNYNSVSNPGPWVYAGGSWRWSADGVDNLVFAQSSVTGDARAAAGPLIDTQSEPDQIVEASARLGTFGTGADPWFGVMARYRDDRNYVYLSLRKSNTVSIRKLVNGQITQLGSAALTVAPGTWYRLRLDAVGDQLRAYVNGQLVLEATDSQPGNGRAGLVSYRTAADFDDFRAVRP